MHRLIKAIFLLGLSGLGGMLIGVIRTKLLSCLIEPAGLGIFGNLSNLVNLLTVIATLGLSTGMVRYVSKYRSEGDHERVNLAISSTFWPTIGLTCMVVTIVLLFPGQTAYLLVGTPELSETIYAIAAAIPCVVIVSLMGAILQGTQSLSQLAIQAILGALAGVFVTVILVLCWGVKGAVWSIPLSNLSAMLVIILISLPVWKKEGLKIPRRISKPIFHDILPLGLAIFVCGAMFYGVMQFLRSRLLLLHGEAAAGYFHAGLQMVSYFYFLAQALTVYLIPRMSEKLEKKILEKEVNDAWRLGTICLIFIAPVLVLFGDLFVRLLLSPQFREIEQFLAILAAIELLRIGGVVLGSTIIARGNQWTYMLVNLCFIIPAITAGILLIPEYGLMGAIMAYCLAWICNVLAITIAIRSRMSISLYVSNLLLPIKGLILIVIAANCANFPYIWRMVILCLLMALALTSIKKNEFKAAFQVIQKRFNLVQPEIFKHEE